MSTQDRELEVLISKLEQCWSDKRTYGTMIWQTPAISTVVIAVLLAGFLSSLGNNRTYASMFVVALFSLGVAIVGTIHLVKQRFFEKTSGMYAEDLQNQINQFLTLRYNIPFQTRKIIEDDRIRAPNSLLHKQSAYAWLLCFMVVLDGVLFGMVVYLLVVGMLRAGSF